MDFRGPTIGPANKDMRAAQDIGVTRTAAPGNAENDQTESSVTLTIGGVANPEARLKG